LILPEFHFAPKANQISFLDLNAIHSIQIHQIKYMKTYQFVEVSSALWRRVFGATHIAIFGFYAFIILQATTSCVKETAPSPQSTVKEKATSRLVFTDAESGLPISGLGISVSSQPEPFPTVPGFTTGIDGSITVPYKKTIGQAEGFNWISLSGDYFATSSRDFLYPPIYLLSKDEPTHYFPAFDYAWLYQPLDPGSEPREFEIPVYRPVNLQVHLKQVNNYEQSSYGPNPIFFSVGPSEYQDEKNHHWTNMEQGGGLGVSINLVDNAKLDTTVNIVVLAGLKCSIDWRVLYLSDPFSDATPAAYERIPARIYKSATNNVLEIEF